MIFRFKEDNLESFEKYILVILKGVLQALIDKQIDIEDAEHIIFKPWVPDDLDEYNVNKEIINIVDLGCELEDIESLLPEILEQEIEKLYTKTIYLLNNNYNDYN